MTREQQGELRKLVRDILYGQRRRWWTPEQVHTWSRGRIALEHSEDDITDVLLMDLDAGYARRRVDEDTRRALWQITEDGIQRVLES